MSTFSRRLLALGLLLFLPAGAWAEDVLKLEIVSAVVEGLNKPGLRLRANTDLDRITVILHRSDGRDFRLEKGPVKNRETVVFDFPQEAGTQHYQGRLVVKNGEEDGEMPLSFDLQVLPGLKLTLLPEKFDRAAKSLALVASRPLTRVEWTVIGDTGEVIGKGTTPFAASPAGTPLTVEWSDAKGTPIRIDLKGYDASNTFALLELSPWWIEVEHDEVHFPSGSAEILKEETPKLDVTYAKLMDAVARFGKLVKINLYVAGYTDTVGAREANHDLSLRRARSIGEYFRKKGFAFPIKIQGFGEDVLAVQTADETDNQANRRALYILGSDMAPQSAQVTRNNWESIH